MTKNIENTKSWTTARGTQIKITSGLILSETINADGDKINVACCEKTFRAEANGKYLTSDDVFTVGYPREISGHTVLGKLGRVYLTDKADVDNIKTVIAKTESHPAWIAKMEKRAQGEKIERDYERHSRAVDKMMGY